MLLRRVAVALLVFAAAAVIAPTASRACMNAVRMQAKEAAKLVAKVEALLEEGKAQKAYDLMTDEVDVRDKQLRDRLDLLQAVARLRIGHTKIALSMLTSQAKQRPDDPYTTARLAEAQTAAKKDLEAAVAKLIDLETRDLVPDAEGWATLARLYDQKSDAKGRDRALGRCKQIAKRAEVCAINSKVAAL
jgi:predicted Zn-dependent protease